MSLTESLKHKLSSLIPQADHPAYARECIRVPYLEDGVDKFLLFVNEQVRVVLVRPVRNRLRPAWIVIVLFKLDITLRRNAPRNVTRAV